MRKGFVLGFGVAWLLVGGGLFARDFVGFNLLSHRRAVLGALEKIRTTYPGCFQGKACPAQQIVDELLPDSVLAVGGRQYRGRVVGNSLAIPASLLSLTTADSLVVETATADAPDLWLVTPEGVHAIRAADAASRPPWRE